MPHRTSAHGLRSAGSFLIAALLATACSDELGDFAIDDSLAAEGSTGAIVSGTGAVTASTSSQSSGEVAGGDADEGTSTTAAATNSDATGVGEGETGADEACEPTLASLKRDVFADNCAARGCHGSMQPALGLDLTRELEAQLIGVPSSLCAPTLRVAPGDPEASTLYSKLFHSPSCGARMPVDGPMLGADAMRCIYDWISGLGDTGSTTGGDESDGGSTTEVDTTGSEEVGEAGDETGDADDCDVPSSSRVRTIFADNCNSIGCHASEGPAADLDLTGDPRPELIAVAGLSCVGDSVRVIPGDPEASLLYQKLGKPRDCGERMPIGRPLANQDVACIRRWIEALEDPDCETCGGAVCIDLTSDEHHCGACDRACPEQSECRDGVCSCQDELSSCDDRCVDLQSDPQHCGECGVACANAELCVAGECRSNCGDDLQLCDGRCVDLQSDSDHCGSCGHECGGGQGCMAGSCGCDAELRSYETDIEPIFVPGCASKNCHGGNQPKANLDLSEGAGYDEMLEVAAKQCGERSLVVSGQADASYLMAKLRGVDMCSGAIMPKSAPPLSPTQLASIEAWICQGAMR